MNETADAPCSREHHARGIGLMVFSTACFTANVLLIRALGEVQSVNVWLISAARFVVGVVLLCVFYWRHVQFVRLFTRPKLAGRGLVGSIGVVVFYLTVVELGAGRATFINNTYVIFGAVLAAWILRERFHASLVVSSVAALAGLALLTNAFASGAHANRYDLLAIAGAIGSAYVVVTIRQLHSDGEHTATIFAAQCVYGLLVCAVPGAVHIYGVSAAAWAIMIVVGAAAAVGQLAMTRAFRDLPVGEGSLLQILVPLGIAAGGSLLFHERFTRHEVVGAVLIVGGTAVTALRR